jgi:hypothetical protein
VAVGALLGIFLTRTQRDVPPVMMWHVKHNRALHEKLFVLTVSTESVAWLKNTERLTSEEIAPASGARPPTTVSWSGQTFRHCLSGHDCFMGRHSR